MATTYTPIATTTTTGNQTSVTFSSIASTYTDLVLVVGNVNHSYAGSGSVFDYFLRFNSDTSTNYSYTNIQGDGSTTLSERATNRVSLSTSYAMASAPPSNIIVNIQNYANTTTYKTCTIRNNVSVGNVGAEVGLWRNTAAITSVTCQPSGSYYYLDGSTFTLYGIKAA